MLHDNLLALSTSRVEDVLPLLEGDGAPDLLIVDSVQTFTSESAEGLPGNVSQVRAVATEIVDACKRGTTTVVLVGHVTKDGALAGPRLLEHMVDTWLLYTSNPPLLRIYGDLARVDAPVVTTEELLAVLREMVPMERVQAFEQTGDLDFAYEIPGLARYRANFFRQNRGISAVFREIPQRIRPVEELGLPILSLMHI